MKAAAAAAAAVVVAVTVSGCSVPSYTFSCLSFISLLLLLLLYYFITILLALSHSLLQTLLFLSSKL
jgi:hypothetical protein